MGEAHFTVEVGSPLRLDLTVWALRRRPHNAIDAWDGATYSRTLLARGHPVRVAVHQEQEGRHRGTATRARLAVEVRRHGAGVDEATCRVVRSTLVRMLGLDVDLAGFYELAAGDERLARLARRFVGVRPPRFATIFEALVNAVACQQLSLTVGIHLLGRLAKAYGPTAEPGGAAPGFPTAERLAEAEPSDLRGLGFSLAKARTLTGLGSQVACGALDLEALAHRSDADAVRALVALPGIGRWSAEYVLLRGLGRLGVLPGDDVGARNSLRRRFGLPEGAGYDDVADLARAWWPYAGLVYFHLLLDGLARGGHLEAAAGDGQPECSAATFPRSAPRRPVGGSGPGGGGVAP